MESYEGRSIRLQCLTLANDYAGHAEALMRIAIMLEAYVVDGIHIEPDGGSKEPVDPPAGAGIVELRARAN